MGQVLVWQPQHNSSSWLQLAQIKKHVDESETPCAVDMAAATPSTSRAALDIIDESPGGAAASEAVDLFFARTASTLDGSMGNDSECIPRFDQPLEKCLPLAKDPTLLQPQQISHIHRFFTQQPVAEPNTSDRDLGGTTTTRWASAAAAALVGSGNGSVTDKSTTFIRQFCRDDLTERWQWGIPLLVRHFWSELRHELDSFLLSHVCSHAVPFKYKQQQWRKLCSRFARRSVTIRVERSKLISSSIVQLERHYFRQHRTHRPARVDVSFKHESGMGPGVTRGWFTAVAQATASFSADI